MRYVSIDLLRVVAIVLMVVVHFLENLSGVGWAPGDFAAPLFGFLVGVSYKVWLDLQVARGRTDGQITAVTVRRGLFIVALGFAFNAAVWLPADTFNWDVLTLIGSAMLLLAAVRDLPPLVPLTVAGLAVALTPVLTAHAEFGAYWAAGYFDPDWTARDLTLGYLVTGYFPVFPWVAFPLIGYVVGGLTLPDEHHPGGAAAAAASPVLWRRVRPVAGAGALALALSLALRFTRPYQTGPVVSQVLRGWTMFPASAEYVTAVLGTVLLAYALGLWLVDGRRVLDRFPRLVAGIRVTSQHSLSLYVLHHALHLWPLWVYGAVRGPEATAYWRRALPPGWSAVLSVLCVVVLYLAARWVMAPRKLSLEVLMRRACDGTRLAPTAAAGTAAVPAPGR